jgi:hypothetical protein
VFAFADDFSKLSSHMSTSSLMMMGSSVQTSFDGGPRPSRRLACPDDREMLGDDLVLDEVVRVREPPYRKEWETIEHPRLLVIGDDRLGFEIASVGEYANLRAFIVYNLPSSPGLRLLGYVFERIYARWCVQRGRRRLLARASNSRYCSRTSNRSRQGPPGHRREPIHSM